MPVRKPLADPGGSSVLEWLESPFLRRAGTRVANQYGLRPDELTELVQELRIALWQARPGIQVSAAWIYRVAQNKAVDILRGRARAHRNETALAATTRQPQHDPELDCLLHARAQTLPERLRQFYKLRYELGLSEREIARYLGVCRASVRWLDRSCRLYVTGAPHRKPGHG